ncbi:MAG: ATP-binding protein [Bacilli bacterium]|nr:ATP-binding protein [Bacilli bacterium]
MATMFLLTAIPGSGKSTWAARYQNNHDNVTVVSSDGIRQSYFGSVQNFDHEKEVWEIFLRKLHEGAAIENGTTIADATNLTNAFRLYYLKETPEYDKHILVIFEVPFERCLIQNRMRPADRVVSESAMEMLHRQYEPLSKEVIDAYDEVWRIGPDFERIN